MNKSLFTKNILYLFFFIHISVSAIAQTDNAPSITADGKQAFCVGASIKIVTDFSITDADDTGVALFFIQISEGYQINFDRLTLTGNHPNIEADWNPNEGKLTLKSSGTATEMLFSDLENAVKDVEFSTSANNVTQEKTFSLTVGDANYLPSTDHFYEFIADEGITWSQAKIAAENRTYYDRKGYLATLTSQEEANFAGKQAAGAGWIGGSDEETEGEWKWVTGPEAGTVFWRGQVNGTTPNFAFWNNNEPNDFRGGNTTGEDYAHITDPSIGIVGAWNDLPNTGGTNLYTPRGYIVEYGEPGDAPLNIVASTSIYLPEITATTSATVCESGSVTISATPSEGTIEWFDAQTGGNRLASGTSFTTPFLTNNTTYYAVVSLNGCSSYVRTPVTIIVNQRPTITNFENDLICEGSATLSAEASQGEVYWFDSPTSTTPIFVGETYETPALNTTTRYYVEANNLDCVSESRTEVSAIVDSTVPEFDVPANGFVLCKDIGTVDLQVTNPQGNYRYIWRKEGELLVGENATITVNSTGNYTVRAISEAGCISQDKTINVRESEKASISNEDVIIVDNSNNNSIQVATINLGSGDYEFAVDNEFGNYQDEGIFQNLTTGLHTLYIRDKGGCGVESFVFSILGYPKFFTPNGDNQNDLWKISGYDSSFYTSSKVFIYNRFGALLYIIGENSEGWDGTIQGKIAPSNDYWFRVTLTDINGTSIEKTGNFSLIRK
jgi:gliding motility-associated-like protein